MSPFTYRAISVRQRPDSNEAPVCLLFSAPAGEVVEWSVVDRLAVEGGGVQRRESPAKVQAIKQFLTLDSMNTIPSSITVALFDFEVQPGDDGCDTVTIGTDEKALVIDGQHRLFGAHAFNPDMPLNIVAIAGPSDMEIAFQFLVINNKASRVPTDHIRLLSLNLDDEVLRDRLASARISLDATASYVGVVDRDEVSPFYRSVIWPVDESKPGRDSLVRPASVEMAIKSIAQRDLPGLETDDALIGFFFAIWSAVKEAWPTLWRENSKLLGKAGLVAMTQFLLDDLTPLIDRGDIDAGNPDSVAKDAGETLQSVTPEFWEADWSLKGLDTQAGRQTIVEDLQKSRRNLRRKQPWYSGLRLVGEPDSNGGDESSD
jgi:DGQHR domain-containing protein